MWSWLEELQKLPRDEWEALVLCQSRPSPFLTPQFLIPWCDAFASPFLLRIGLWRLEGRLVGLVAFYQDSAGRWELCGGQDVADRLDALVEPGLESQFWSEFYAIASGWKAPLRFPNVAEDSALLTHLPDSGWEKLQTDSSPFLRLPQNFEDYLGGLSKKNRHEVRRKLRRAEDAVTFESVTEPAAVRRRLVDFIRLHRRSLPDKSDFMTGAMERFFVAMTGNFADRGQIRIGFLSAGDEAIASMLQFDFAGSLHLYNSGYNPDFAHLSPGVVVLAHCIREAIQLQRSEFDFLRGTERYKYDLGGIDRGVFRVDVQP